MRVRGRGWVLLAATAYLSSGCAGSDSSERASGTTGGFYGGQTGSLTPCSTPPQFTVEEGAVPGGDAAFVFHSGCAAGDAFSVLDENGDPVPFVLVDLEEGVVLVRADSALEPGSYTVAAPDGTLRTVVVTDPAPLPTRLGTLSRPNGTCSNLVELQLDPSVLPYAPLLRLEFSLDGAPAREWFPYGTLPPGDTSLTLALEGLSDGAHQLSVQASVAGEISQPDPVELEFSLVCSSDAGGGPTACSVARKPGQLSRSGGPWWLAIVLACGWRRRRGRGERRLAVGNRTT